VRQQEDTGNKMTAIQQYINLFKIRIGVVITLAALGGMAITPGQALSSWKVMILTLTVMLASAAAGAFNQWFETDLDAKMTRTQNRPFLNGYFKHGPHWLFILGIMLTIAITVSAIELNLMAAWNIFLGAFTYGIVYTVWLKRRTWLNIVFGGLAGSFAVLAGAAAVDPTIGPLPALMALVLFLWTPPHFWSLAIVKREQYANASVPMLPVIKGDKKAARIILGHTILLVIVSILPYFFGLDRGIYLFGAVSGGLYFLVTSIQLVRDTTKKTAMVNFIASLVQFCVLMIALMVEVYFF
jgi:protoheme IX farnesyltransferase